MHHRVSAWVIASCAAPLVLLLGSATLELVNGGIEAMFYIMFWQGILAFLLLSLSLVLFSPVLLLPLERNQISLRSRRVLGILALLLGVAFAVSLLIGPQALSVLLGVLFDGAVYLLTLQRPNRTVERDEPQAARPSP
jgi:hypothetical protein